MEHNYPFDVIYEDNHLIIVNKQSGVLVQEDESGDTPLVEMVREYLKEKYKKEGNVFCSIVHRLDRPVSGLIILAKTSKALERMNEIFKNREIHKTYWAITEKAPDRPAGHLKHWLVKDKEKNKVTPYHREVPNGLLSELDYKVIGRKNGYYLIEVNPITGRPHQIRVQLMTLGCVIVGDVKYGYHHPNPDARIHLHARRIRFIHPVQKTEISFSADLPNEELWNLFKKIS
ncbi:MAG: RluA family pseudouridine synthase [Thermoflexibacter sp.]|jgi:23S rRNA pseudouridine1911/1915/1917 synthase|nr:RluA family pseudouridine synthase [Thermoflexibacter sp.]